MLLSFSLVKRRNRPRHCGPKCRLGGIWVWKCAKEEYITRLDFSPKKGSNLTGTLWVNMVDYYRVVTDMFEVGGGISLIYTENYAN